MADMSEEPVKNGVAAGDAIDGNTSVGSSGSAGGKKNKKGKNKNKYDCRQISSGYMIQGSLLPLYHSTTDSDST